LIGCLEREFIGSNKSSLYSFTNINIWQMSKNIEMVQTIEQEKKLLLNDFLKFVDFHPKKSI
jgi:hypothetical protein